MNEIIYLVTIRIFKKLISTLKQFVLGRNLILLRQETQPL